MKLRFLLSELGLATTENITATLESGRVVLDSEVQTDPDRIVTDGEHLLFVAPFSAYVLKIEDAIITERLPRFTGVRLEEKA